MPLRSTTITTVSSPSFAVSSSSGTATPCGAVMGILSKRLDGDSAAVFWSAVGSAAPHRFSLLSFAGIRKSTGAHAPEDDSGVKKAPSSRRFAGAVQNALVEIPLPIPLTGWEIFAKSSGLPARFRYQSRRERLRKVRSHYQLRRTLPPLATFFGYTAFRVNLSISTDYRACSHVR
jgi:hypothetical protein